jgi:hypothetical protein
VILRQAQYTNLGVRRDIVQEDQQGLKK